MDNSFIPQSRDDLFFLGNLHIASRAIHLLSKYPIADYLQSESREVEVVAKHFGFEKNALGKLFHVLTFFNILREEQGLFSLTEVGKYLCHSHPESLKNFLFWDDTRWTPLGKLEETIKDGSEQFSKVYGEDYFNCLSKNRELQNAFDQHMKAISYNEEQILGELLPKEDNSHFIDIGGGKGGLLEVILEKNQMQKLHYLIFQKQLIQLEKLSIKNIHPE